MKNNSGETRLHLAVPNNSLTEVKRISEHGADVNLRGEDNKTALHSAIRYADVEILKRDHKLQGRRKRRKQYRKDNITNCSR